MPSVVDLNVTVALYRSFLDATPVTSILVFPSASSKIVDPTSNRILISEPSKITFSTLTTNSFVVELYVYTYAAFDVAPVAPWIACPCVKLYVPAANDNTWKLLCDSTTSLTKNSSGSTTSLCVPVPNDVISTFFVKLSSKYNPNALSLIKFT